MRKLFMLWTRSLIFNIAFFTWTAVLCLLGLWVLLFPPIAMTRMVHFWASGVAFLERTIIGLHYKVVGMKNIPKGPCIIAAKHQSIWETCKLYRVMGDPAVVLKSEITSIPVLKWYGDKSGMIPIDRSGRAKTLSRMTKASHAAKDAGRRIVIFPQGTRTAPGDRKPYKSGVAALYKELELPIVPMALNSGVFWPRRSFIKKPGTITMEFLPPIPPGLPRAEMMQRLESELEKASDRLVAEVT